MFALIAGISRSGITMVAGLVRGLPDEEAARFSFLLATGSSSPRVSTSSPICSGLWETASGCSASSGGSRRT